MGHQPSELWCENHDRQGDLHQAHIGLSDDADAASNDRDHQLVHLCPQRLPGVAMSQHQRAASPQQDQTRAGERQRLRDG